ncbi:MAG TPA: kynureninase [Gammaproteobacteria bacterium]|nr:kynureninase [Gammaproteobacteria bacterium]
MKEDWLLLARESDADEASGTFRERFCLPPGPDGNPAAYLCGHSLGLCPKSARELVAEEFEDWAALGVEAHIRARRPWVSYHEELAPALARIVGAREHEVVAMNSLTTNLHLMMASFYRPVRERHAILIEKGAFPSDRHAVVSQLAYHGYSADDALIELAPRAGAATLREKDIEVALEREGGRVALVLWPGVQYLTGQAFDLARIARAAHEAGAVAGFDLAHAVGNLALSLHDDAADFAVWCSYKYLNGGPGAPGGCFVHERHGLEFAGPRFTGWWGHDKRSRFAMGPEFLAIPGAEGWQLSNPPVFALAPLLASLRIFDEAGIAKLRARSLELGGFLADALAVELGDAIEIITPAEPDAHGAQLSLRLRRDREIARRAFDGLAALGVVADWREPDVIRVAPAPLYCTHEDCARLVNALHDTLRDGG